MKFEVSQNLPGTNWRMGNASGVIQSVRRSVSQERSLVVRGGWLMVGVSSGAHRPENPKYPNPRAEDESSRSNNDFASLHLFLF